MFASFQTSKPQRTDLVEAVARDEVPDEGLHEVRPAIQVAWRRDEADVVEDPRPGVGGERFRHERQLHERTQARREQAIDDEVDLVEVVSRGAVVILGIHAEDVVEDSVRPDHLDPELVADDAERLRKILPDRQPAGSFAAQEQREVLGADHVTPRPQDRASRARGIDHDAHLALALGLGWPGRRRDRSDGRVDAGQAGHGIDVVALDARCRIDVRPVGDREDVTALVVDGLEVTLGRAAVDEIANRALDRGPGHRHLAAAALCADLGRRGQGDVGRRPVTLGRRPKGLEPGDPGGRARDHGSRNSSAAARGPALNVSMPITGRSTLRNSLVANDSRRTSSASALPIAAMTIPWSSDR